MTKKKIKAPKNFDDLGQDVQFEYGGVTYTIPAISQATSEELAEIAQDMREAISAEDYRLGNVKTFEYVVAAMAETHSEEELRNLPKQVISAVMRLIGEDMLGVPTPEEMTEIEEKSAKK